MADFSRESMLDMFIYEMNQLIESLEQNIIQGEQGYSMDDINEIFRIMHTIKGSAAMMMFDNVSKTAHSIEDLFYYLREENPSDIDYSHLTDLVLEGVDFIKIELAKIEAGNPSDEDPSEVIGRIENYLKEIKGEIKPQITKNKPKAELKKSPKLEKSTSEKIQSDSTDIFGLNRYRAKVFFEDGCEMENVRAFTLLHNLGDIICSVETEPEDVIAEESAEIIRSKGFSFSFSSEKSYEEISQLINETIYLKSLELKNVFLNKFKAHVMFEEGCEMENVRAYTIIHNLKSIACNIVHVPKDVIDEAAADIIRKDGFKFQFFSTKTCEQINEILLETLFLRDLELEQIKDEKNQKMSEVELDKKSEDIEIEVKKEEIQQQVKKEEDKAKTSLPLTQPKKQPAAHQMISVNIIKLDQLLNLMGELVIAEAMTTQNPDLEGLELESFSKSARQLRKIINDVQDTVMSMRMVSLATTFFKMHRIVRDMCKQLNKDVQLEIEGEETEVDKNIIEHISDPLMHIIRNSVDHGIETPKERKAAGKDEKGTVFLEAKNSGGEVLITVKDNGCGLNRDKILEKAKENGLLKKPETEYTDREIHQFIFLPGFSTNEAVTSFSGRGVGMDVVTTNIEAVGGSIVVESDQGEGTTTVLKIPLTLAIIEGMLIKMGGAKYTIPISSIQETFKVTEENLFTDPDGNEMLTLRGEVYNIVRLYDFFNAETEVTNIEDGVLIMLENEGQTVCLFVDELIGEQQVVVKTMPRYIKKIRGISGCTLLGNGDISLIIDVAGFFDK